MEVGEAKPLQRTSASKSRHVRNVDRGLPEALPGGSRRRRRITVAHRFVEQQRHDREGRVVPSFQTSSAVEHGARFCFDRVWGSLTSGSRPTGKRGARPDGDCRLASPRGSLAAGTSNAVGIAQTRKRSRGSSHREMSSAVVRSRNAISRRKRAVLEGRPRPAAGQRKAGPPPVTASDEREAGDCPRRRDA